MLRLILTCRLFAEYAPVDDFYAIIRNRVASMISSSKTVLSMLIVKMDPVFAWKLCVATYNGLNHLQRNLFILFVSLTRICVIK